MHNSLVKAGARIAALVAAIASCAAQAAFADAPSWRAERTYCAAVRDTPSNVKYPDRPSWASEWRCASGRLLICFPSADGVPCSIRRRAKTPTPAMVEECASGAEGLSVASGAYGFVWRWTCRDGRPVIVGKAGEFDASGYAHGEWSEGR
jgi:hypothetical protein